METPISLYYFSGTNNTLRAAEELERQGTAGGLLIKAEKLGRIYLGSNAPDFFLLMSPVYGGGLPRKIYKWARTLPPGEGKKCALVMTAAGGEHWVNRGAGTKLARLLKRQGYHLSYTRILGTPSNWLVPTPDDLARALWAVLPEKCAHIVSQLKERTERDIRRNPLREGLLGLMAYCEDQIGARLWGRFLKANSSCTGCGKCVRHCPMDNIRLEGSGPVYFGWNCVSCMGCVYLCPVHAITPRMLKAVVLKGGYDHRRDGTEEGSSPERVSDFKSFKYLESYLSDRNA
ncbi:MAG: EFR1 family ferrodoxin [Spirochaetales bacterium]|nr:EFR1 family ferrodoxin [Spirochaetales bacterium]